MEAFKYNPVYGYAGQIELYSNQTLIMSAWTNTA
jgi:hypothetical protein